MKESIHHKIAHMVTKSGAKVSTMTTVAFDVKMFHWIVRVSGTISLETQTADKLVNN